MDVMERIRRVSANLRQQKQFIRSVEAAKQVSVVPFIQALGYDLSNLNEVSPAFVTADGSKYDFAILVNNQAEILIRVIVDSQFPLANLSDQLSKHLGPPTHRIGIVSDGINYSLYAPVHYMKSVDVELIMRFDLSSIDETSFSNLKYLSKHELSPRQIVNHATHVKQKNDIRSILESNYMQPSEEFVRFFAAEIHGGVLPLGFVDALAPLVKQVFREFVEGEHKPSLPTSKTVPKTSVRIPVYANFRGGSFRAVLEFDESHHGASRVTFNGITTNPSRAALSAVRTVVPSRKAVNGWTFWKLRDPQGNQERSIDDLRIDVSLVRRMHGKA